MTLSREYFKACGPQILSAAEAVCPGLENRLSIGLAGDGSQCFGYDDAISQDHDFAPGFCIWMSDDDFHNYGPVLQKVYWDLPASFCGFSRQNLVEPDRLGVMSVSDFYIRFTGIPETDADWLFLSEAALASAVNGEIWIENCHEFQEIRQRLSAFYPEDILRKKIAARAAVMAQAGQYNLLRMTEREDRIAVQLAAARFAEASISLVHLLCRKYTPFYKWAFRSLSQLAPDSGLASCTAAELAKLPEICALPWKEVRQHAFAVTETICAAAAAELRAQGFSQSRSTFLQDHLPCIMKDITDPGIRAMHPMADPAF